MIRTALAIVSLLSLVLVAACGGGSGEVTVDSITLQRDDGSGAAGDTVTAFKPSDRVQHAKVQLNQIGSGAKVHSELIAVDAGGQKDFKVVEHDDDASVGNVVNLTFSLPNDWPAGSYKLDVYLNGKLAKTQTFSVQ